jgi:hypothetical protein
LARIRRLAWGPSNALRRVRSFADSRTVIEQSWSHVTLISVRRLRSSRGTAVALRNGAPWTSTGGRVPGTGAGGRGTTKIVTR